MTTSALVLAVWCVVAHVFGSLVEGGRRLVAIQVGEAPIFIAPESIGLGEHARWRRRLLRSVQGRAHCGELPPHCG